MIRKINSVLILNRDLTCIPERTSFNPDSVFVQTDTGSCCGCPLQSGDELFTAGQIDVLAYGNGREYQARLKSDFLIPIGVSELK